jgi:2-polyprenyl-6-methoxyphenol hydroxylase-like FAD-dependent oxidoreductase
MPSARVLICGAGVAGSILAFWLAKHDFEVVVLERSKAEQKLGQGLEIEQPALKVVELMGILDELNERQTGEMGFELVSQQSKSYGVFEVGRLSPTGALEMMRGDLTEVLYRAANKSPQVTYKFETTIQNLRQTQDQVIVDLEDKTTRTRTTEKFDFVVGADGVRSRTRQLLMGSPEQPACLKPIGAFVAYFSIPRESQDWPYSRACLFPGRRIVWLRPTGRNSKTTSVYLMHVGDNAPNLSQANASGDRMKQKQAFAELFSELGWETARVTEEMMKAENFYSDELAQVKLPRWSQGRVVLLGDAAWAPTPFTGQGNQLAIIGGWVLAQEMARTRAPAAFDTYEKRLRSYVEESQNIPLGGYAPYVFMPETKWGIWMLQAAYRLLFWTVRLLRWTKLSSLIPDGQTDDFDLEIPAT